MYIQEAHPSDGWQVPQNLEQGIVFDQPKTESDRADVAEACLLNLNFRFPMAIDEMSNAVDNAYAALPDRLYLVAASGTIRYRSDPGPWGFNVDAWEKAIADIIKDT